MTIHPYWRQYDASELSIIMTGWSPLSPRRRKAMTEKYTREQKENMARQAFCAELPLVMERAGRLGMFRTMHKLHEAVKEVGYEWADLLAKKKGAGNG